MISNFFIILKGGPPSVKKVGHSIDLVRSEIDAEQSPALAPSNTERFPRLREDETLTDYLCRGALAIYERERAHLGSHSAAAHRLGMHRNTLYDWLEWARQHAAE